MGFLSQTQSSCLSSFPIYPGATCIPVFLPLTVLYLLSVCRSPAASVLQWPPPLPPAPQLWDPLAVVLVAGWMTLQSFLYLLPVGKVRRSG